jgi:hypothetical protein
MIRTYLNVDTRVLDSISNYADRFSQRALEIAERVYNQLADEALEDLRKYPPPPPNSKYKRTYRLRNGWRMELAPAAGGFTIVFINDATDKRGRSYPKYVQGSLAKARATAAKWQAWMHKGRWPLAFDTVDAFYDLFMEAYQDEFKKDLADFGSTSSSRRTFTR